MSRHSASGTRLCPYRPQVLFFTSPRPCFPVPVTQPPLVHSSRGRTPSLWNDDSRTFSGSGSTLFPSLLAVSEFNSLGLNEHRKEVPRSLLVVRTRLPRRHDTHSLTHIIMAHCKRCMVRNPVPRTCATEPGVSSTTPSIVIEVQCPFFRSTFRRP